MKNPKHLMWAGSALLLAACSTTPTPYLDSRFGYSVNTAKSMQTLNPDAGKNPDPVAGIDGPSAREGIERYHDSFKAPPPTFEVLLGNGAAGGGR